MKRPECGSGAEGGHVVKGLEVMQRLQRGAQVEGTEVTPETRPG